MPGSPSTSTTPPHPCRTHRSRSRTVLCSAARPGITSPPADRSPGAAAPRAPGDKSVTAIVTSIALLCICWHRPPAASPMPGQRAAADGPPATHPHPRRAPALRPRTPRGLPNAPSASKSPPSPDDRQTPAPPDRRNLSSRTPGSPWRRPAEPDCAGVLIPLQPRDKQCIRLKGSGAEAEQRTVAGLLE